jgi:excisionase family DNA binding protein
MDDVILTVTEVSKLIKTDRNYVYKLINAGILPVIKLGSIKVRRSSLMNFLENNEGNDLTDPFNVKKLGDAIE